MACVMDWDGSSGTCHEWIVIINKLNVVISDLPIIVHKKIANIKYNNIEETQNGTKR